MARSGCSQSTVWQRLRAVAGTKDQLCPKHTLTTGKISGYIQSKCWVIIRLIRYSSALAASPAPSAVMTGK